MTQRHRILVLLCVLAVSSCARSGPSAETSDGIELRFDLSDKGSLAPGDAVVLRGFDVGRITAVDLREKVRVTAFIERRHAAFISTCAYGLSRVDWTGTASIEVIVVDGDAPPIRNGTTLSSAATSAERLAIESKLRINRAMDKVRDGVAGGSLERGLGAAKRLADEGVESTRKGLAEMGESARGTVRGGIDGARQEIGEAAEALRDMTRESWRETADGFKRLRADEVLEGTQRMAGRSVKVLADGVRSLGASEAFAEAKRASQRLYEEGGEAIEDFLAEERKPEER